MNTRPSATLVLAALITVAACEAPADRSPVAPEVRLSHVAGLSQASGGGHYLLTFGAVDLPGKFSFTAVERSDGSADGMFRYTLDFLGQEIDFHGEVTCVTVDLDEGRAWIGGVVTLNQSVAEPFASGEIYQEGRDIWFRVLDSGEGSGAVDRTTFVGFEGGAGIITSQEYCDLAIWAENDARTWPVTGNVQVH